MHTQLFLLRLFVIVYRPNIYIDIQSNHILYEIKGIYYFAKDAKVIMSIYFV